VRRSLHVIDERIDARVRATRAEHPWWPCAAGCDHCCRSLPHLPTISDPEWARLRDAISELPASVQAEIVERTEQAPASGPVTCPLLDRGRGICRVYEARPIACRTYGFYTERDGGLHCDKVTRAVADRDVIWGNGEAIADDLRAFGPVRSLVEHLREG
jgi:Fe-S-cluster containining protein